MDWEYKKETDISLLKLNILGANGWELITVLNIDALAREAYFKRPLP